MDLYERTIKVLRASRVFGTLDAPALNDLAQSLVIQSVRGGSLIFREGEPSDSMLFVISGGLRVSRQGSDGVVNLYNEVRPGQSAGEIGLILQQPRSADVTAMRDSSVAVLSRASFEALLVRYPLALNRTFVHTIHDFMRRESMADVQRYAQAFVVIPLHEGTAADEVASSLTAAFSKRGRVHHVAPPSGPGVQSETAQAFDLPEDLEDHFEFLVYEAEARPSDWTRRAFRQADQIIFVAQAGSSNALGDLERELSQEPGFAIKRKHLVLLHPAASKVPVQVASWRGLRQFERIYPLRQQNAEDFERLSRFLTGNTVGVVLGGGGARGFAHLGVLRALQESGIPVDLVGGNSMGALIGAQYASGLSLNEILTQTQRFAAGGERITLPLVSIVSGRRVERDLQQMFGDTMIDDLWRPFFAVACNLTKGVMTVQDSGKLWRAVLASNSPAGLFPPVLNHGDLLVDGAILDNVPVHSMRVRLGSPLEKRRGNGIIIAIDVDVREELSADPGLARLSLWRTVKGHFSKGMHRNPGIADILYSAGHIGSANQRGRTIKQSDYYLEPPVADFPLMGYARAQEILDVGYRYAIEKIEQWNLQRTLLPQTRGVGLSLSQREVWLDQRVWPESAHLNIGGGAYLQGPLNVQRFTQALAQLVAENDALRLVPWQDGHQEILEHFEPTLEFVDLSNQTSAREAMRDWWQKRIQVPFALDGTPPWRFALLHGSPNLHGLTIQFHHLVMDGWGTTQVMRRWSEIYNALEEGSVAESPSEPDYLQFIEESNAYRSSPAFERDAQFWEGHIAEIPAPLIERRYADPNADRLPASRLSTHRITRADYERLETHAGALGSTSFNYFLAALVLYFARINNYSEVVVGVPSLNRGGKRFKSRPGMFVGVMAIKVGISADMTVSGLLSAVSSTIRRALRHARYPLSELGRARQVIRHGPEGLLDVLLSFELQDYGVSFGAAELHDSRQLFSGSARYPLGVTVCEFHANKGVEMILDASSACFAQGEADLLARRLWHLVERFMATPEARLQDVSILPVEERWELLHGLHKDVACHETTQTYVSLFERQAALRPHVTALVWDGGSIDYATLDRSANQLAHRLRSMGAGADKIVALGIARSPEMVVALLAVGKAGAAFLPLDLDAPIARLADILRESGAIALLVDARNRRRMATLGVRTILVGRDEMSPVSAPLLHERAPVTALPNDLAYVVYTSGSTGKPKGVMVEHATLSRRLAWLSRAFAVDWRDRSAQATQLTFDPSLIEIFLPLVQGASIALPPAGRLLPEALVDFAVRHEVTVMAFVPSTLARFLSGLTRPTELKLRVACCGGEVLPPDLANRFIAQTGARLFNVYGPTETAIFATAWSCGTDLGAGPLPIGRPIDDTRIYILDAQLRPLPMGALGEIFIGGAAIARGYLHSPELSREVFLDDPFKPGSRIYRTGDRGWFGLEGNLHFAGRLDRQVKLRGYRIELGEIESACLAEEGVTQAAAKLVQRNGKPQIHVWVAGSGGLSADRLQRALRSRLPDYMIPGGVSVLPTLPQSGAGKIDYASLPEPGHVPSSDNARGPANELEKHLLSLWEEVIETRPIAMQDNFFDLGGDSLDAVSILTGMEKHVGRRVPMHLLTQFPTIEQLASAIAEGHQSQSLVIHLGTDSGRMRLYLAASGNGDVIRFQNLARALGSTFDVRMLQPPDDKVVRTMAQLAELYVQSMGQQGLQRCAVAGFSVGGIAALETARLLVKGGHTVSGVVLIDTIYPNSVLWGIRLWRTLGWLVRNLHVQELSMNGRRLSAMFNDSGWVGQVMSLKGYRPQSFDGTSCLIKSSGLASWERWFFRPWRRLMTGSFSEYQVPGLHGSIFEVGNVGDLAAVIASTFDGQRQIE